MNWLWLYQINYIIIALGGFFIVAFVFSKGVRKKFNLLYALMTLSLIVWAIGRYALLIVDSNTEAIFWGRFLHIGSILVHIFFLHTVLVFTRRKKNRKLPLTIFYFNSFFILSLNLVDLLFGTNLFLKDLQPKLFFPWVESPSGFYHLHLVNEIIIPLWAFGELIFAYRKSLGILKLQLRYIILAAIFGFVGGNSVIPLIYNIPFNPSLVLLVPINIILMTYAFFRLRLMDIRVIILRSLAFGFIVSLITAIYAALSALIATFFENLIGIQSNLLIGIIISLLVVAGYRPLRGIIERITNTFLFKKTYDPDALLAKISLVTSSILNLEQLLISVADTLEDAFHYQKIAITLLNKKSKLYIAYKKGFSSEMAEKFAKGKETVLPAYFKKSREIQVIDELKTRYEAGEYQPKNVDLLMGLYNLDIALIIPLFSKEKLIGLFVLGNKKSGDPYNSQDLSILKIIAGQSAVAIENARLYGEVKDFSVKLKEEVKRKTAELREANKELRRLDTAKSEFISIASHQLRTPLTIVKGYISMIQEGSFGEVPIKINDNLTKVYDSNERLIGLVDNLLDISRIESGKQKYHWQDICLENMAQIVVDNLKKSAKDKGLKLFFHKLKKKTPKVVADSGKLHEVMMNFVDNAIKYTEKGKINVSVLSEPNGMVSFCVKDTGRGIDKEIKKYLFKKFSRGKGSFTVHTEGLGLGLYVAKILIDAHKGKIWAESEGRDKGSKFCFSLPVKKK